MSVIQDLPTHNATDRKDSPPIIRPVDDREVDDSEVPEPTFIYIGEYADREAYFNPLRQSIMLGEVHGDAFTEEAYLEAPEAESLEDHIQHFLSTAEEENVEFTLSKQALALLIGERISEKGWLPEKQAKVYLLRRVFGVERQRTAALLDIAPSTVDSHFREATSKVDAMMQFSELLEDLEESQ